jgi:negative regulator of flagellin synthesis FlgM
MSFASGIDSLQQTISSSTPPSAVRAETSESAAIANEVSIPNSDKVDQANVSPAANFIVQALEGSDARSAKVESLQQAIAAGSYNVSSAEVANKIIEGLLK